MKVLLITTLPNAVEKALRTLSGVEVSVIDCAAANACCPEEVRTFVFESLDRHYEAAGSPDMLVTYRCPCIIPQRFWETPMSGSYNIHPSLLPQYPGMNPWEEIFRDRVKISGVTIHRLSCNVDSGEIVMQKSFEISCDDSMETARNKADILAAEMICRCFF